MEPATTSKILHIKGIVYTVENYAYLANDGDNRKFYSMQSQERYKLAK